MYRLRPLGKNLKICCFTQDIQVVGRASPLTLRVGGYLSYRRKKLYCLATFQGIFTAYLQLLINQPTDYDFKLSTECKIYELNRNENRLILLHPTFLGNN